ncbi:MAG TPA: hypothetical protein VKT72_15625 [Candidatus Baltobacteraceae bacterium]|nr:hypothetical protein [Candidatus Baltobacteraceae bacterium]
MRQIKQLLAVAAASSVLAACSSSQFQPPAVQQSNPGSSSYSDLQFAVGTANIGGTPGLNVVSTLRQPNGLTADLVNTPTLTGPFSLAALATGSGNTGSDPYATIYSNGPSPTEKSKNAIMGTPQIVRQGTPACDTTASCPSGVSPNTTTFGEFGGIERMGFFPGNSTPGGSAGSYVPYNDPIYATSATTAEGWVPWGGPPAYDDSGDHMGTRDGVHHSLGQGVLGVFTGMTVFQMAPVAGSYTLATVVPTGLNSSNQATYATITKSASLTSTALLPTITPPTFTPDANGDGGGTLAVTLPAGATEGMVTIEDIGPGTTAANPGDANCQGSLGTTFGPVYYTIEFTSSGTITLPAANGPNVGTGSTLTPSASLCSAAANATAVGAGTPADQFVVQYFAMDYPLYEASEPSNRQQAPTIAGSSGQSDITISAQATATY